MREIQNNELFGAGVRELMGRVELNSGTAQLEFEKSDGSFATLETFSADAISTLPTAQGQRYRVALAGGAKFFIGYAIK